MKAALNGIPSLSVLDGWWIEGCLEGVTGWRLEKTRTFVQNPCRRISIPLPQVGIDHCANVLRPSFGIRRNHALGHLNQRLIL